MAKITLIPKYYTYNCDYCGVFCKKPKIYYYPAKARNQKFFFCSKKCFYEHYKRHYNKSIKVNCAYCGKPVIRLPSELKKTKHSFCNNSCATIYNMKRRKKSRRSKIEIKFFDLLVKEFPALDILPNDKKMLDGLEVDVAIPSLKLAIEWNGIVHFKPIYGQTKLDNIQKRDANKLKISSNKNINLIVISDLVSNDKILQKAFDNVKQIINSLL